LRSAEAEARRLGHSYVGTEHLLLALLRSDGPALQALLGVSAESVEPEVRKLIGPPDA
jgi:ATP-dependent Clp protease ATP-binding subunit ClpC